MTRVFDISSELEMAARIPFRELELTLIWSIGIAGFPDGEGGTCVPTVWRQDQTTFVSGYQTDDAMCVVFLDWPVSDLDDAKEFAIRVTGLACEH